MTDSESAGPPCYGAILVTGDDAATFLRAQLTNDLLRLGPDRHFLAGWCDAKGRVQMIARVVELHDGYLLLLPAALVDAVLPRLRMYVLRARVKLIDVGARWRFDGLVGDWVDDQAPAVNRTEAHGERLILGLPASADRKPRALVLSPAAVDGPENAIDSRSPAWRLARIDAGIPAIYPATQGLFVPQMLNLHWLMAVDFDKGCYPGQEVIARLHYRGRLTRRLFRMSWSGQQPAPGDTVVDDRGQTQGTIVDSAAEAAAADHGRLLAVVKVDADLHALFAGTAALQALDLPYATPD